MDSLGTHMHLDCNPMGDVAKISPRVPSTCVQNAILSLLIIHIIPSRQIYVAIDNPSLLPSISCLISSSYLWNYVRAADDVSHAKNLQTNMVPVSFSSGQISRQDPSYPSFNVMW
jgi:hypothetical protein